MSDKKVHLMFDTDSESEILVEGLTESNSRGEKKYKIRGIFSTIGEKNRNGRIYPRHLWEREVQNYQNIIESGNINSLMEYEHPARTEVDQMEAVAKITSLKIEGNYVMGEAVLLDNPKANQLKTLIDNGIKVCVSSRGAGSVKNGIVESYKLITYDVVPFPSDYNAVMNGLVENHQLNEGIIRDVELVLNESGVISKKEVTKKEFESAVLDKFTKILESL